MRSTPLDTRTRSNALASSRTGKVTFRLLLAGTAAFAATAGACPRSNAYDDSLGARIASIACAEHERWFAPFISADGRLASMRVSEAETTALVDGTPAWQRVAQYWHNSGVRWPSPLLPDGTDCSVIDPAMGLPASVALCRAFLIDTPWSAVFVSYVMTQAGVPGFAPSVRHVDYVRSAYDGDGPYRIADPLLEAPAAGDLLCFVRQPATAFGYAGLRDWLERHPRMALGMHCDVAVTTRDGHARLVGGNVLQGVTMRMLPVNRAGRLWNLPRRTDAEVPCHPDEPAGCNLNRQDWAALLKLDPALKPAAPASPAATPCCTACPLPMPPGLVRCEAEPGRSP
jgi:hypothetical protein